MRSFDLAELVLVKLKNYLTFSKSKEASKDLRKDENDVSDFMALFTGTFLLVTVLLVFNISQKEIQLPSSLIILQFFHKKVKTVPQ